MADYPVLPLWVQDYIAGTYFLSTEQHGAHLLMLINAWLQPDGRLPNDDKVLAKMTCCTRRRWEKLKPAVMPYWTEVDGRLASRRLDRERADVIHKKAQKREAGRKGQAAKKLKKSRFSLSSACFQLKHRWSHPSPSPRICKKEGLATGSYVEQPAYGFRLRRPE